MDAKYIYAGAGALLGLGVGGVVGYFVRDKKANSQFEEMDAYHASQIKCMNDNFQNEIERKAEELAKDMLMAAAERRSKAENKPKESADENQDVPTAQEQEDPVKDVRMAPENTLVNRNIFDQDPTTGVDYTKFQKVADQVELHAGMDPRVSAGFARNKQDVRDDIDAEEAEDALADWESSHDANGRPIVEDSEPEAVETDMTEDEQAIADGEFDRQLYFNEGSEFQFITEDEYSNTGRIFDKQFVMYCDEDAVWCDEDNQRIEDPHVIFGYGFWRADRDIRNEYALVFEEGFKVSGETERFFIRNRKNGTDYEVMRYHRSWEDMMNPNL